MFTHPDYDSREQIYSCSDFRIYRAFRLSDHRPVLIKISVSGQPIESQLEKLRFEYEMLGNLYTNFVVSAYGIVQNDSSAFLVLQDIGGSILKEWGSKKRISVVDFLQIAIQITEGIEEIHRHKVIHSRINPFNILYNHLTSELNIINFNHSSYTHMEADNSEGLQSLAEHVAYMAPEQTGRMNRIVDGRADLYSLGVTFYELLAGKLPFPSSDPVAVFHSHMTAFPEPICTMNPEIPRVISDIVMKLMVKDVEERYQSARGLKYDLEICCKEWKEKGEIGSFPLGQQDFAGHLHVSKKLYGREKQLNALLSAFSRVRNGRAETILVSGYSGVGKSELVHEFYESLPRNQCFYLEGKFDLIHGCKPYAAWIQCFNQLIKQLLRADSDSLERYKNEILHVVDKNGKLITDLCPLLEVIIGSQPDVVELESIEAEIRFVQTIKQFLKVFTSFDQSLVIFIDDLQWADQPSLRLFKELANDQVIPKFLLIGAYRDNAVDDRHMLTSIMNQLTNADIQFLAIPVQNLIKEDVIQLLSDTLQVDDAGISNHSDLSNLSDLLLMKTGGNAFYVRQLIHFLYGTGLLYFDPHCTDKSVGKGEWRWDAAQIEQLPDSENVIDFMAKKANHLQPSTQNLLKMAACLGNRFNLDILAWVMGKTLQDITNDLNPALIEGMLISAPDGCQFAHDRIQQAFYSMFSEKEKLLSHRHIAKKLQQLRLETIEDSKTENSIFEIVDHYNYAIPILVHPEERMELAKLNLAAGKLAKAAAAYTPSLHYFTTGIQLLIETSWEEDYALSLALYEGGVEMAYCNGQFAVAETWINVVLKQAHSVFDKIMVYCVKNQILTASNKLDEVIQAGLETLKLLGVHLPAQPIQEDVKAAMTETNDILAGRKIMDLLDLPEMKDPQQMAIIQLSGSICSAAFQSSFLLFGIIICKHVSWSVQYGNLTNSALTYASYATIVDSVNDKYEFGQLALQLAAKKESKFLKTGVFFLVGNGILHWRTAAQETLPLLSEAFACGMESGNLEFGGFAAKVRIEHAFYTGYPLKSLTLETLSASQQLTKLGQVNITTQIVIFQDTILRLQGSSERPWDGKKEQLQNLSSDHTGSHAFYLNRLIQAYLFHEDDALRYSMSARVYLDGVTDGMAVPVYHFYDSLACLAACPHVSLEQKEELLTRVSENQQKMYQWATHAPVNYLHKFDLVEAEMDRVLGNDQRAADFYERAIQEAHQHQYINEEALAYELAAKFYLAKNKFVMARAYLQEAHYLYMKWGAMAKARQLKTQYPFLFIEREEEFFDNEGQEHVPLDVLDLRVVWKASQVIANEKDLTSLMKKMIQIVIETSGAETGYLIIDKHGSFVIEAQAKVGNTVMIDLSSSGSYQDHESSESESSPLPESILNYVVRMNETVVLDTACKDPNFQNDPYIKHHQSKSILCFPLVNHGKTIGAIYLENNAVSGAFSLKRVKLLELLSSQMAVSLENARLWVEMESLLAVRTLELRKAMDALETSEKRYRKLAEIDNLTGVYTRLPFFTLAQQVFAEATKFRFPLSAIMADIDRFKSINDTYGHFIGDCVLKEVANRLQMTLRQGEDLLCRFGGEEFAILLPKTTSSEAKLIAERLRVMISSKPIQVENRDIRVSISLGVTEIDEQDTSIDHILNRADKGLYLAKNMGRNRVVLTELLDLLD